MKMLISGCKAVNKLICKSKPAKLERYFRCRKLMHAYKTFAISIQGITHVKRGKVCQDASGSINESGVLAAAVSDGHGGDMYFRSDRGSQFAVEVFLECVRIFAKDLSWKKICEIQEKLEIQENSTEKLENSKDRKAIPELLLQLVKSFTHRWRLRIEEDVKREPFTEEELANLPETVLLNFKEYKRVEKAYGATLVAVVLMPEFWFALQIGDGTCAVVKQDGSAVLPIPADPFCSEEGTQTSSLCESKPVEKFRFEWGGAPLKAAFVGTDGIENCYPLIEMKERLKKLYAAVYEEFEECGLEKGTENLKDYMNAELSRSGDDLSMAGIVKLS